MAATLRREQVEDWIQTAVNGGREVQAWLAQPDAPQHPAYAVLVQVDQGTATGITMLKKVAARIEKAELAAQAAVIAQKMLALDGVLNG